MKRISLAEFAVVVVAAAAGWLAIKGAFGVYRQDPGFQTSLHSVGGIPTPAGYYRATPTSFTEYLRSLPLSANNTVYLYNGEAKAVQSQYAVLDLPVGDRDLMQCADAVMRIRAQYLKEKGAEILFHDNDGTAYRYDYSSNFEQYLTRVFSMCGTASLSKELSKKAAWDVQPGDVLVRGGFPGHAIIVLDVARRGDERLVMLAQGYMPAQSIHILQSAGSPWIRWQDPLPLDGWQLRTNDLKTWPWYR